MVEKGASGNVTEGTLLWEPSPSSVSDSNMNRYMAWLEVEKGLKFKAYGDLWAWSVKNVASFWESIWDYYSLVSHAPFQRVFGEGRQQMPEVEWFPGVTINYAEHAGH